MSGPREHGDEDDAMPPKLTSPSQAWFKPLALRCVYQVARQVKVPIIGIGGIATIDDVLEFLVAGASAVQIGTANFFDPTVSMRLADALPAALQAAGAASVRAVVATLAGLG